MQPTRNYPTPGPTQPAGVQQPGTTARPPGRFKRALTGIRAQILGAVAVPLAAMAIVAALAQRNTALAMQRMREHFQSGLEAAA